MLSRFLRKRKRESQLHPKVAIPRILPTSRSLTVMSLRSNHAPPDKKVVVDEFVVKAMELETEALLRCQNPSTVCALAVALAQQDRCVMALYNDVHGDDEDDSSVGISSIMKKWKLLSLRNDNEARTGDLKSALQSVECGVDSGTRTISNWQEAKEVLSAVVQFPDDEQSSIWDVTNSTRATPEVEEYRRRIKEATRAKDLDLSFSQSRQEWKRLAESRVPERLAGDKSDEPSLVDDGAPQDAISKSDEALGEQIAKAYAEHEERRKTDAMRKLEERLAKEEREAEAEELASSLLRPLTPDEKEIVHAAMFGNGPQGEVLIQVGTDSVQRQSMQRLQPGQWLNDEVIHYFYVMLAKRDEEMCRLDPSRKRNHFFKSFFITKLLNEGNADPSKDGQYEYKNVKRWSKKVPGKDIFKLDKIFFPINQGQMHWMCAVIRMKEKCIQMYDSMGSDGMHYLRSLFRYLQDEHMEKKGVPLTDIDEWELVGYQAGVPCQRNGYDCGVFTCMFADFLSRDWPLVFSQEHITQCRERIALSIMLGSAIL